MTKLTTVSTIQEDELNNIGDNFVIFNPETNTFSHVIEHYFNEINKEKVRLNNLLTGYHGTYPKNNLESLQFTKRVNRIDDILEAGKENLIIDSFEVNNMLTLKEPHLFSNDIKITQLELITLEELLDEHLANNGAFTNDDNNLCVELFGAHTEKRAFEKRDMIESIINNDKNIHQHDFKLFSEGIATQIDKISDNYYRFSIELKYEDSVTAKNAIDLLKASQFMQDFAEVDFINPDTLTVQNYDDFIESK